MDNSFDNNKDDILYLDDEFINLDVFKTTFDDRFNVHIADNEKDAKNIIGANEIKVVISDQRMPDISGIEFITWVNNNYPNIVCILLTGFSDNATLLSCINKVNIFRFIMKPWIEADIILTIFNAVEIYNKTLERQKLINDLNLAREKAIESDRLKSSFLSNISHELRTPLNGIMGFSSMFDECNGNIAQMEQYKLIINESCENLIKIIDDIVTASQVQKGDFINHVTRFDLSKFMKSVDFKYTDIAQRKNIKIKINGINPSQKFIIEADRNKLYEVFNQLLNNAFKFTRQGYIEIGIEIGETITFYIEDTGIGIPESKKDLIFDFFRQGDEKKLSRHYGGNGLGLSIAKGLVEMIDGKIWFKSTPGVGSTFYFNIPVKIIDQSTSL